MNTSLRHAAPTVRLLLLTLSMAMVACNKAPETADAMADDAQAIGAENIAVARQDTLRSGPAISGMLIADREARLRAELSGAVLQTLVDAGQRVSAGTVLGRLDDATVRDAVVSARSGVAQATIASEQAARELQRAKVLVAAGAIAERDVEGAERAAVGAQAQLDEAKARLSGAEKGARQRDDSGALCWHRCGEECEPRRYRLPRVGAVHGDRSPQSPGGSLGAGWSPGRCPRGGSSHLHGEWN